MFIEINEHLKILNLSGNFLNKTTGLINMFIITRMYICTNRVCFFRRFNATHDSSGSTKPAFTNVDVTMEWNIGQRMCGNV